MSELMSQHEAWQAARARLGAPPARKPRMRFSRAPKHPLWVPTLLLLAPPPPDWTATPTAPYDEYVSPPAQPLAAQHPYRWREILMEVCAKHGFTTLEIRSKRRERPLVFARHEAMWRLRNETSMSLPEIGRRMGGRDHTTAINGVKKHQQRIEAGTAK